MAITEKINNIIGRKYGKLTVIGFDGSERRSGRNRYFVSCICECGCAASVEYYKLRSGHTRSCGCLARRDGNDNPIEKHGKSKTPLYSVWNAMLDRCTNRNMKFYDRYGGRGICVCDEWYSFTVFERWAMANGYKRGLEIDRIDNDSNYSPENCRWVTHAKNLQNTHRRRTVSVGGVETAIADIACRTGEKYNNVYNLMKRGKTGDEIISIIKKRQENRRIRVARD